MAILSSDLVGCGGGEMLKGQWCLGAFALFDSVSSSPPPDTLADARRQQPPGFSPTSSPFPVPFGFPDPPARQPSDSPTPLSQPSSSHKV